MLKILHQISALAQHVFSRFVKEGFSYQAAALTFTSLLSLVPLMLVMVTILSALPVSDNVAVTIQNFIIENFVPQAGQAIAQYLQGFMTQATKLSVVGSLFLVVTAVMMIYNMDRAFNRIWHIKQRRKGVGMILLYWSILTLAPLLMGLSIFVSSYLVSLPLLSHTMDHLSITAQFWKLLPFLLIIMAFTLFYKTIPNCRVPIGYAFSSGVVAALLFETAKYLFTLYLVKFPTYELLYGALAIFPIFLIWVYLSWVIILFGVLLTHALTLKYARRVGVKLDGFTHAYCWLGYLWQQQQQGESLSLAQLVAKDSHGYQVMPELLLQTLMEQSLIARTTSGCYVLNRDLSNLTLAQLYLLLPWKLPTIESLKQLNIPLTTTLSMDLALLQHDALQYLNKSVADYY